MTLTRKQLYDLVWSKPLTQLAKEYAISDNGLRKICKKHNIPLPKLGYWQKLRYGKKIQVIALPKVDKEVKIELQHRKDGDENQFHYLSEYHRLKKQIENDASLNLIVPDKLSKSDPLIIKARADLQQNNVSHRSGEEGLIVSSSDILDIEVSKSIIPRALRFMDTLIKLLKQRGHSIKVNGHKTLAIVNNEEIPIRCREKLKRVIPEGSRWSTYIPSGLLSLKLVEVYGNRNWSDRKQKKLEDLLPNILTSLELKSKNLKQQRKEREEWQRQYKLKKQKEEEAKRIKENEFQKLQELLTLSHKYKIASEIRNFIVIKKQLAAEQDSFTEETKQWIHWAKNKADWIDPFVDKTEDEILGILKDKYLTNKENNSICKFKKWNTF